jgi:hypothetical protein
MVRQVLEGDGGAGVLGWVSLHLFVWPGMSRPLPWLQRRVTEKVVDERTALINHFLCYPSQFKGRMGYSQIVPLKSPLTQRVY